MLTTAPSPALHGTASLPGDKSMSHRAALFAALAAGESVIDNFLDAGVTRRMLAALTGLGVRWELENGRLTVHGAGPAGLEPPHAPIDCGNSGTTLRLLAGAVAAAGLPAVLDGSAGLRARPMNRIVLPLMEMGARVAAVDGRPPLTFTGGRFPLTPPERFHLNVASAQVKTCLLLAGLSADRTIRIVEPGPSRDHSERMLKTMGAAIRSSRADEPNGNPLYLTEMEPPTALTPLRTALPGDFSSAAFLIAAALICKGSDILIEGVGINPTRTGMLDAMRAMGADITVSPSGEKGGEPFGDLRIRHSRLRGTTIDGPLVVRMIDEFPALAIVAAFAEGPTLISGAEELRHKESDRIRSLCSQLRAIGIPAEEKPDGFLVPGGSVPSGGVVRPFGDHRIAMAFAVAGLGAGGLVAIAEPEVMDESFPGFIQTLLDLGARIDP
ncbi:MAG TPA: 3-phosphoshikimate 1-carboxyvinyltransferase [Anaerolineales bacterium]|nr:3-phosphoshikimate 1-carboxyvinyltransferase [Anaerolineales bacterium]